VSRCVYTGCPSRLFVIGMNCQPRQIALLYAASPDDQLVGELLSDEPVDVIPFHDVCSLFDSHFGAEETAGNEPTIFAVLVWARKFSLRAAGITDHLAGELSQLSTRYKRIIVLSDAMDETTVCKYLEAGAHHVIPIGDSPRLMHARLNASLREHAEPALS